MIEMLRRYDTNWIDQPLLGIWILNSGIKIRNRANSSPQSLPQKTLQSSCRLDPRSGLLLILAKAWAFSVSLAHVIWPGSFLFVRSGYPELLLWLATSEPNLQQPWKPTNQTRLGEGVHGALLKRFIIWLQKESHKERILLSRSQDKANKSGLLPSNQVSECTIVLLTFFENSCQKPSCIKTNLNKKCVSL